MTGAPLEHRKQIIVTSWFCLYRITRITVIFAREPGADVPVTRESQHFALRGRELRLPCR